MQTWHPVRFFASPSSRLAPLPLLHLRGPHVTFTAVVQVQWVGVCACVHACVRVCVCMCVCARTHVCHTWSCYCRRPHKDPPSQKRVYWEYFHKFGGRLFLLLALINIFLGLYLVMAPAAVVIVWSIFFGLLVVAYGWFEYQLSRA